MKHAVAEMLYEPMQIPLIAPLLQSAVSSTLAAATDDTIETLLAFTP